MTEEPTQDVIVQGTTLSGDAPEAVRAAMDHAFDYRGDVTIVLRDGSTIEGYVFDRRNERTLDASRVSVFRAGSDARVDIGYPQIAEIRFSGRDPAAGRSWENWVRRYAEQKLAGEQAGIDSERLD
jgi:hypothetical protein